MDTWQCVDMRFDCTACEGFGEMSLGEDRHGERLYCKCDRCGGDGEARCGCGAKAVALNGGEPECADCRNEVKEAA